MKYQCVTNEIIGQLSGICGTANVLGDRESLAAYARDEYPSEGPLSLPEVVVRPRSTAEVSQVLKLAHYARIPVTPRGGGTGLAGGALPLKGGIMLSLEKLKRIIEIDHQNLMAVVQAGVNLGDFFRAVEDAGLFFPPHPGSESAMIGGVIATNAGGVRALKYGVIRNFVRGLEFVLADGRVLKTGGKLIKNSAGYSLMHLMLGSEGTLGVITEATIALRPPPNHTLTLIIPFPDIASAIKAVPAILKSGSIPLALEFVELEPVKLAERLLDKRWPTHAGKAHLMIILEARDEAAALQHAQALAELCMAKGALDILVADTPAKQKTVLDIRSNLYEAIKPWTVEIFDIAVPPAQVAEFMNQVHALEEHFHIWLPSFGHAGDGNIHTHFVTGFWQHDQLTLLPKSQWQSKLKTLEQEIIKLGLNLGGTITGEHGVGCRKKPYMKMMYNQEYLTLLRQIKKALDPHYILNPGKVL